MDSLVYLTGDRFPLVRDIGWNGVSSLYTHPDRLLDFDVFIFVVKGQMHVIEENNEYKVKEKEHLFLKKGLHHWGKPETPPGTVWYWVHFNSLIDHPLDYKDQPPLPELEYYAPDHYEYRFPLPKHGTSPLHESLENRLHLLAKDFGKPKEYGMTHLSLQIYQLFLDLHQSAALQEATKASGKAETIAGRAMEFLRRHPNEDFDSEKLSAYLKLNYSYASAAFKKQTGHSLIDAHTKLRMNHALELIRSTSLNVSEISERLGYQNPYYFSRVFKKVFGEPPSAYMRHFYKS